MRDREIHGESNVRSAALRQRKIYGLDVHVGFEGNYGSVGYGKQCLRKHVLGWALDFDVEGQRKNGRPKRTWKMLVEKKV